MSPLARPSRTFHAVCAYWLMSSDGSKAKAPRQHASRMPSAIRACLYLFAPSMFASILPQEAVSIQRSAITYQQGEAVREPPLLSTRFDCSTVGDQKLTADS